MKHEIEIQVVVPTSFYDTLEIEAGSHEQAIEKTKAMTKEQLASRLDFQFMDETHARESLARNYSLDNWMQVVIDDEHILPDCSGE